MKYDHTAFIVKSIKKSVDWYSKNFNTKIIHYSEDWAFLDVEGTKLALSTGKHPYHLAFEVTEKELATHRGKKVLHHRDGTKSVYYEDLDGNAIELIVYPKG